MQQRAKKANSGRGTVGKTPVAGAKDRETNRVSATVIQGTTQEDLEGFIQDRVEPGATLYTDDHSGYNRLWLDFEHSSVRHSVREFIKGKAHTNGIESFLGSIEAWLLRHLPPHERETPTALRQRVFRSAQHPVPGYHRPDGLSSQGHGWEAVDLSGFGGVVYRISVNLNFSQNPSRFISSIQESSARLKCLGSTE